MPTFPAVSIMAAVRIGLLLGLGAYAFLYATGYSYLTNDPAESTNCQT